MRTLVTLGVLGLALTGSAQSVAQPQSSQRTHLLSRAVFVLVAPDRRRTQRVPAADSRSAKRHAPNPAFAGYSVATSGTGDVVARFRVPDVACSKREAAIGAGAFLLGGPHDRLSFNAADVIVGCYHKVATAQEAVQVNGVEFDYVRPVQPGDVIIARLTDTPTGQVVVQLRNLNPRRPFVLTRRGRGFTPDAELVGDWASADAKTGAPVPPPEFDPTTFRSISVNGHAFGSASPTGYDMSSSSNVLQVTTSPLSGPARDRFTCTRRVREAATRGFFSGPWRDRTSDLGIKSPLLYQLS
jgi:hypothetical protein